MVDIDEGPRAGTTRDSLGKLRAAFRRDGGTVTAGNASGINDGAAAIVVMSARRARERGLRFTVVRVDGDVAIEADRQILSSVVGNLLQNAFKFTRAEGHVSLRSSADADRVRLEVEDECGGLPPGDPRALFLPFKQRGDDRTGLGLGLAISRRGVEASGGVLKVRNLPGKGCVFTIDLPRAAELVKERVVEAVA